MKFFFDNNISFRYADMLKALQVDAVALREEFSQSIQDADLFEQLRGSDRVFITGDISQSTRLAEALALKEAGITALFFGPFWAKKRFWQQAIWLVTRWEMIAGFAGGVAQGTCAEIKENGKAHVFQL